MDSIEKAKEVKKTSLGKNFTVGELSSWIRRIEKHSIVSKKLSKFQENFDFEELKEFWEIVEKNKESKIKTTVIGKKLKVTESISMASLIKSTLKLENELSYYVLRSKISLREKKEFYKFVKSL